MLSKIRMDARHLVGERQPADALGIAHSLESDRPAELLSQLGGCATLGITQQQRLHTAKDDEVLGCRDVPGDH